MNFLEVQINALFLESKALTLSRQVAGEDRGCFHMLPLRTTYSSCFLKEDEPILQHILGFDYLFCPIF